MVLMETKANKVFIPLEIEYVMIQFVMSMTPIHTVIVGDGAKVMVRTLRLADDAPVLAEGLVPDSDPLQFAEPRVAEYVADLHLRAALVLVQPEKLGKVVERGACTTSPAAAPIARRAKRAFLHAGPEHNIIGSPLEVVREGMPSSSAIAAVRPDKLEAQLLAGAGGLRRSAVFTLRCCPRSPAKTASSVYSDALRGISIWTPRISIGRNAMINKPSFPGGRITQQQSTYSSKYLR
mmetsp:Transcript_10891/g.32252  ORF Transcript_10891/g.32252 Transcript_10891/m.32252 type:complete len:236 (+) Transcript_10891:679-1386(+)